MRRYAIELVGSFFLVLTFLVSVGSGDPLAALAVGSVLMVLVYAGGGAPVPHFNPAVSLGAVVRGRLDAAELLPYSAAQLLGTLLAAVLARWLVALPEGVSLAGDLVAKALVVELLFTFALTYVVLTVGERDRRGNSYYGLAIGFAAAGGLLVAGPISGGVLNPGVAFGGAVSGLGTWGSLWVLLVATFAGGALAGLAVRQASSSPG